MLRLYTLAGSRDHRLLPITNQPNTVRRHKEEGREEGQEATKRVPTLTAVLSALRYNTSHSGTSSKFRALIANTKTLHKRVACPGTPPPTPNKNATPPPT